MDDIRRAELYARRAALLEQAQARNFAIDRADYVRGVPILAAIEAAGDDYDSFDYRRLPSALNHWAHDPRRWAMREESYAVLPADPAARDAAILAHLWERLGEHGAVIVILRRHELVLEIRMSVLVRHFAILIDTADGDWLAFATPPAGWIVAVRRSAARLGRRGKHEIITGILPDEYGS